MTRPHVASAVLPDRLPGGHHNVHNMPTFVREAQAPTATSSLRLGYRQTSFRITACARWMARGSLHPELHQDEEGEGHLCRCIKMGISKSALIPFPILHEQSVC